VKVIVQSVVFGVVTFMRPHGLNPEIQGFSNLKGFSFRLLYCVGDRLWRSPVLEI
jgi:hypothetical protein